jgi:hypothetical protein
MRDCIVMSPSPPAFAQPAEDPFENLHRLSNLACLWLSSLRMQYTHTQRGWSTSSAYRLRVPVLDRFLDAAADSLQCLDLSYIQFSEGVAPDYTKSTNPISFYF